MYQLYCTPYIQLTTLSNIPTREGNTRNSCEEQLSYPAAWRKKFELQPKWKTVAYAPHPPIDGSTLASGLNI
jgi:hypothetical protein